MLVPSLLFGQSTNATITGQVGDPTKAVIPQATVTAINNETNARFQVMTSGAGTFVITALPPGSYRIQVEKAGFRTIVKPDVVLHVQDVIELNFEMALGSQSETVTVEAGAPLLNTQSGAVSTVVDQQFVQNMPLNGRSFQSLIAIVPGVVFTQASPMSPGQFSVNGQRTNTNYFTVDGVSGNFGAGAMSTMGNSVNGSTPAWNIAGGTNGLVSIDAMQEFRIQTSTYSPEFGRSPGGQISIVTRSGSNAFHGSGFDYVRNDILDARNFFNTVPQHKPPLRQNDFGGTFGGPIFKDKTFFFFSYEGLRLRQPVSGSITELLTPAARQLVAPVWRPFVAETPLPTVMDANGITGSLPTSFSVPNTLDAWSIRVDHSLTSRINLFGRYNRAPSNSVGSYDGLNKELNITNIETATLGASFTVSANKVNEFRANWSRTIAGGQQFADNDYGSVQMPESALYPKGFGLSTTQIYFISNSAGTNADPYVAFGTRVGLFSNNVQRQINIVDTLSWTKGAHQLKFGFDYRRMEPTPSFTLHSIGVYASWADLQAGTLSFCYCSSAGGNTIVMPNYSAFAQDTWRVTLRLTLTYGLRWDVNPAPTSATNNPLYPMQGIFDSQPIGMAPAGTPMWHTRYANFAPRVGAAYQVTPKTVLRGGFGMFYDLGAPQGLASQIAISFPYSRAGYAMQTTPHSVFSYSNPSQWLGPAFSLTPSSAAFLQAIDPNLKVPFTYQWNVAFERELGKSQTLTVSYVGSKGEDLIRYDSLYPGGYPPPSNWYSVGVSRNGDWSNYNAMQVSFQRRMSRGLQAMLNYTLAKSTDTASQDTTFYSQTGAQVATTVSNLPPISLNYGNSDFDMRHSFNAAFSWEIPSLGSSGFVRAVTKGWALDGTVIAHQGLPINILANTSVYLNGVPQRVRANVVPGQAFWISDPNAPGGKRLNPAAFSQPAAGTVGNEVRNSIRDFPLRQADMALRRRFNLGERVKMDLRVEYFNIFNHPNLSLFPYGGYWNSNGTMLLGTPFGYATQTQNVSLSGSFWPNQGGSMSAQYGMGGPRSGQLTVKFSF
jgi:hypothetical protein